MRICLGVDLGNDIGVVVGIQGVEVYVANKRLHTMK